MDGLADEERMLLGQPVRLDRADIYPSSAEPHFLVEPPAPEIGEVHARYVELPGLDGVKSFRRLRNGARATPSAIPEGSTERASGESSGGSSADVPSGATQLVAMIMGIIIHLGQGLLAGVSLIQLASTPWPDDGTLSRPMAYATVALPMHRTIALLSGVSFLAACDLHAAAPRVTTAVLVLLYALIVILSLLSLPTDVALHVGRSSRVDALQDALDATVTSLVTNSSLHHVEYIPFRPDEMPELSLEDGGGFFSTALSARQFGFWQALMAFRAVLACICWLLASLLQSRVAFEVPPIAHDGLETTSGTSRW